MSTDSTGAVEALRECPHCGGEAELLTLLEADAYGNEGGSVVQCSQCLASGPVRFSDKEDGAPHAIAAWNRRASSPPPVGDEVVERPDGAIHNGRVLMDRLENAYDFACEAGPLRNCWEWSDLRRCFDAMADALSAVPQSGVAEGLACYAIRDGDGKLLINTVYETRRGAIVNWLLTARGCWLSDASTDESIEAMWGHHREDTGAEVVPVCLSASPPPPAPGGEVTSDLLTAGKAILEAIDHPKRRIRQTDIDALRAAIAKASPSSPAEEER